MDMVHTMLYAAEHIVTEVNGVIHLINPSAQLLNPQIVATREQFSIISHQSYKNIQGKPIKQSAN